MNFLSYKLSLVKEHLSIKVLIGVTLFLLLYQYGLYSALALGLLILLVTHNHKLLINFSLILYVVFVGDINEQMRTAVHVFNSFSLSYLLFNRFGFHISQYPKISKEVSIFILLLIGVMVITSVASNHIVVGLLTTVKVLYFFIVVYFFYSLITSQRDLLNYFISLVIAGIILSLSAVMTLLENGLDLVGLVGNEFRTGGFVNNVNALSIIFAVLFPILIIRYIYAFSRLEKRLILLVILILASGLFVTLSRSTALSIVISTLYLFYHYKKKIFFYFVLIITLVFLLVVLIDPIQQIFLTLFRLEQGLSNRDNIWTLSWMMFQDNFLFGVGPGAWGFEEFNYFPIALNSFYGREIVDLYRLTNGFNCSHNFYLIFATDMGLLGLIVALLLPLIFFLITFRVNKKVKKLLPNLYWLPIGINAMGVGMFVRGFFEGLGLITFGRVSVDIPFWIMFMILIFLDKNIELCLVNLSIKKNTFIS
ncbi:MAG: O-antigen ligase family protein [Ignavibacteriales bacterium]|nr:O-antigen ligase family protein [Ignavibacteriales bacterium]